ncbi:terpene synthase family protein [Streptomyces syringium]|uniref:terpene synthase family protein n=1 Tax=Streptomyces syringium TaxID=76729 RepID=UPI003AAA78B0
MRCFGYITTPAEEAMAREARFGELGALTYPHGALEGAVLAAQLMVWLFLQDDRFSERAPAQGRIEELAEHILWSQRVLHSHRENPAVPEPYLEALVDLRGRLGRMAADPEQVERFADGFNRYLGAVAAEAIYRAKGIALGMCEAQMRRFDRLSKPLAEEGDAALARYVRGLGAWIRGNLDWSMSCGRYHVAAPQPPGELPSLFGG